MPEPIFSVVIPTYNAGDALQEAVSSIIGQDIAWDYEILVVDDGSTDGSTDALPFRDDRIRIIHKPNGGPGSARNVGVRAARSGLIAFLDADDHALPERFTRQIAFMLDHPQVDLTFGNWIVEDEPGDYLGRFGFAESRARAFTRLDDPLVALMTRGSFIPTSTAVLRRSVYLAAGLQPEDRHYAEDYSLWCRIAARGGVMAYSSAPLAWYRTRRAGRLTRSPHTYAGQVWTLQEALVLHGPALPDEARKAAMARFVFAAEVLLRDDWIKGGRRQVLQRLAELAPLLPPAVGRRWELISLVPRLAPYLLRTGRRRMRAAVLSVKAALPQAGKAVLP